MKCFTHRTEGRSKQPKAEFFFFFTLYLCISMTSSIWLSSLDSMLLLTVNHFFIYSIFTQMDESRQKKLLRDKITAL